MQPSHISHWITFVILTLVCIDTTFAQRTDVIKYYIALDGSGSIPIIDSRGNLKLMFDDLVKESRGNSRSQAIFDVNIFGESTARSVEGIYGLNDRRRGLGGNVMRVVNSRMNQNNDNMYSHIHTSLNDIASKIVAGDTITGGIFVFTDGKFQEGDFKRDEGDANFRDQYAYIAYVKSILKKLSVATKRPVFFVQSSFTPYNPFLKMTPMQADSIAAVSKFYFDKDIFWIKNNQNFSRLPNNEFKNAFDTFIAQANDAITAGVVPAPETVVEGKIYTAISIQETLNILELLGNNWAQVRNDSLRAKLQRLDLRLNLPNLNRAQVQEVNTIISDLSGMITQINELKDALIKAAANPTNRNLLTDAQASGLRLVEAYHGAELKLTTQTVTQFDRNANDIRKNLVLGTADYVIERAKDEAIFAFLDNVNNDVLARSESLKKIFPNVARVLDESVTTFNLAILREAFKRDLKDAPQSILLHSDVKKSGGLVALYYLNIVYQRLMMDGSIQNAFRDIAAQRLRIPYKLGNGDAVKVDESVFFVAQLINYLEDNNLASIFNESRQTQLDKLAKMIITLTVGTNIQYDALKIEHAAQLILKVYQNYLLVREDIKRLQSLMSSSPQGDYDAYRRYQKEVAYDILWRTAELTAEGVDILDRLSSSTVQRPASFTKDEILRMAHDGMEFFFLVRSEDYLQAALIISPYLLKPILPEAKKAVDQNLKIHLNRADLKELLLKIYDAKLENLHPDLAGSYDTREELVKKLEVAKVSYLQGFIDTLTDSTGQRHFKLAKDVLDTFVEKYTSTFDDEVLRAQDFFNSSARIDTLLYAYSIPFEFRNKVIKVLSIAGELSTAQTPEEIKAIIGRYSLPVASYRMKRTMNNTLTLSTYAGVGLRRYNNGTVKPAIVSPIGVDFSTKMFRRQNSVSVFASIIDIGNVIDYRLLGSDQKEDDVVKFENIFSPGIFLTIGTGKKLPLSLGAGYQANPSRFNIFIAFDLPIVNFWSNQ